MAGPGPSQDGPVPVQGESSIADLPGAHGDLSHLLPPSWTSVIPAWLAEDTPSFDWAGFVVGDGPRTATLYAKSPGVLAGAPFFAAVFAHLGCRVDWRLAEGSALLSHPHPSSASPSSSAAAPSPPPTKQPVATVSGPVRALLLGERVALNALARCSGVATASRTLLLRLRAAGYGGVLAGTRKTTPGFRLVEKYGMLVGGADAHRVDLSGMVMLKDNHVWARGGIRDAVGAARNVAGFSVKVEVEVQSEEEADEAIGAGADVVMLDNFSGEGVRVAARSLKQRWAGKREFLLEVSGGLTPENVGAYVCPDIDIISTSSIHQGVPHVDFSLKLDH